ncbi:MAG: hypothetical protein QXS91_03000 [Candidatus Anstonellales archaeon]
MKFYKKEVEDILIASFVLALSFSIATGMANLNGFLLVSLIVLPSFLLHELAHKFVAQYYGYLAAFLRFDLGLLLALVSSLFGFVFAAPGAVFIQDVRKKEHLLKISIAGPLTNIALALIGLFIIKSQFGLVFAHINAMLALFNLIPFGPLDGFKIFSINKILWFITTLIALIVFLAI